MLPEIATEVAPARSAGSLTDPLNAGAPSAKADAGATRRTSAVTAAGSKRRRPRLDPFETSDGVEASDDARAFRPDRVNQMREVCKLIRDLSLSLDYSAIGGEVCPQWVPKLPDHLG